jgi:hypothetical protein
MAAAYSSSKGASLESSISTSTASWVASLGFSLDSAAGVFGGVCSFCTSF